MSMTDSLAGTDVEIQNMEAFEFDQTEPCSFPCENVATWYLLCPYDRNAEPLCDEHRAILLAWDDDEVITFNETCNHSPDIASCAWEPIIS
jgi:hypothetical protein